ncbi:MAG: YnbE family lipoprotein [Desulfobacteraceae bacterium]|nr:MAG: YnbE family lipoprotein [Desulfobacteraceae bacterium]
MLFTVLLAYIHGCQTHHKVETVHKVEVAPMHITIDVNVRVDRALDDFFADLDKTEEKIQPSAK